MLTSRILVSHPRILFDSYLMETVIGLLLNDKETCLPAKNFSRENLPESTKFLYETLHDTVHVVALDSSNINTRR